MATVATHATATNAEPTVDRRWDVDGCIAFRLLPSESVESVDDDESSTGTTAAEGVADSEGADDGDVGTRMGPPAVHEDNGTQ